MQQSQGGSPRPFVPLLKADSGDSSCFETWKVPTFREATLEENMIFAPF